MSNTLVRPVSSALGSIRPGYARPVASPRIIPGERCNIGPDEIARRRRLAIVGTVVTTVVAVVLIASHAPVASRLLLGPLAAGSAVTWLQVVRRFCVRFGAFGLENFGALGRERRVDPAMRSADARKALEMVLEGVLVGALVTVVFLALPG